MTTKITQQLLAELFAPNKVSWDDIDPCGNGHNLVYAPKKLTDHEAAAFSMLRLAELITLAQSISWNDLNNASLALFASSSIQPENGEKEAEKA